MLNRRQGLAIGFRGERAGRPASTFTPGWWWRALRLQFYSSAFRLLRSSFGQAGIRPWFGVWNQQGRRDGRLLKTLRAKNQFRYDVSIGLADDVSHGFGHGLRVDYALRAVFGGRGGLGRPHAIGLREDSGYLHSGIPAFLE